MQLFLRKLNGDTLIVEAAAEDNVAAVFDCTASSFVFGGVSLDATQQFGEVQSLQDGATICEVPRLMGGGDGTEAMGKKNKHTHGLCIRCGKRSYHIQKKKCASCGYPAAKKRSYEWSKKAKRRQAQGTGRMRHLKHMARRFKHGFREGGTAPARKKNTKQ
eukprot:CAMPEP_0176106226 /NCGR_PEP_ID=MMETSP0120_2-20121206/53307_1 /TAXON_ID=160619 /ORGANISM="Kryptoperidinium foliaceum, Strain CCMP 1326" /LENGTH=160 /DNA_ID=CAMNT_0017440347 /DNA_START=60 /DNA_END=542 /DNA_ORIENTATION=+